MRSLVNSTSTAVILRIGMATARAVKKVMTAAAIKPRKSKIHSTIVKNEMPLMTSRESCDSISC